MSRKGENIYKRKDGRWEGRYIKKRTIDKTYYGYIYGKTYKEVKGRLIKKKSECKLEEKESWQQKEERFDKVAVEWLADGSLMLKESTIVKYKNVLQRYMIPTLGKYHMSEITNDIISEWVYRLLTNGGINKSGLSQRTVSSCITVLKSIQKYAVDKNIKVNITSCHVPIKQSVKPLRVFTIQEQQILYVYLKSNITSTNLGILICLFTGIRLGEVCALKWEDISIEEKTMSIHQTMQRIQTTENAGVKTKIMISKPKSDSSIRIIPLPNILLGIILTFRQNANSYVLTGDSKKYIEPRTMQYRFKAVLKNCGIADANFHTLRHTFATRCVEVGFDIKTLSEILGHTNVNITLNQYVHPSLEMKHENMSKLSDLFSVK